MLDAMTTATKGEDRGGRSASSRRKRSRLLDGELDTFVCTRGYGKFTRQVTFSLKMSTRT